MKWSDLTLKERKQIYDAVRAENPNASYFDIKSQFDSIPEYEDGGKRIVDYVNSNNVNFVNRLKNPFRQTINDWETQYINKYVPNVNDKFELVYNSKATHKLSAWEGEEGRGLIVPNVQEINGKLVDFTRPPYNDREALRQAFKTGDFVETDTYNDAEWYTQNYKKYYPSFEDGGKKIMPPKELGLTPGTPEYYKRQQQISGKAELVQPEAYVTPAGYIKDAIDFGEDVYQGNYGQAMIDVALNALPWGSSKIAKRAKRYLSRIGNSEVTVLNSKSSKSKVKTEADYDSEFSEVIRRERNIKKYNDEISRSIETAVYPDEETLKWLQFTDNMYGTNYQKAYKELAARDMTNRSKYIKYSELPDGIQGKTIGKNIDPNIGPTIGNYQIQLDPQQYVPGTGSHELSHVVDQLAGDVIKNRYLNFLADSDNIMSVPELEKKGIRIPPKIQFYLSDPQEAKAHMIQLKHAMLNSGKINNWSQKVTQQELEDFLFDPLNTQLTGSMNKLQYKMYRNKSRFLDRFNRVNPLAIGAPIGLAATNNKDKQSN